MSRASRCDFTAWSILELEELASRIACEIKTKREVAARKLHEDRRRAEREGLSLEEARELEAGKSLRFLLVAAGRLRE